MATRKTNRLSMQQVGPIRGADVTFGDLTVIVGPQATGKSIFLQTLKLVLDRDHIHDTFRHHSVAFNGDSSAFWAATTARAWRRRGTKTPPNCAGTANRPRCLTW